MDNFSEAAEVPLDFPSVMLTGAVSGVAPKILAVRSADGKYRSPEESEEERMARWQHCEDLARQLADAAVRSKRGKRAHMSEQAILDQYLPRLSSTGWTTAPESRWIIGRVAAILNWPLPSSLLTDHATENDGRPLGSGIQKYPKTD